MDITERRWESTAQWPHILEKHGKCKDTTHNKQAPLIKKWNQDTWSATLPLKDNLKSRDTEMVPVVEEQPNGRRPGNYWKLGVKKHQEVGDWMRVSTLFLLVLSLLIRVASGGFMAVLYVRFSWINFWFCVGLHWLSGQPYQRQHHCQGGTNTQSTRRFKKKTPEPLRKNILNRPISPSRTIMI